jgi:hypothetical protein
MTETKHAYEATVGWGTRVHAVVLDHPPTETDPPYTTACGRPAEETSRTRFGAPNRLMRPCVACTRRVREQIKE